tara:strand:+ start:437 stop:1015 length:579 start_codon:yes stop_codon:yes gene_type:complete
LEKKDYGNGNDEDLLKALKAGSSKAFDELYSKYWKYLYLYAYNLLEDSSICEDIVQDIFTQLYSRRKNLQINNLKSYLFQAVKFQVIKHFRRNKLMHHHVETFQTIQFSNQTEDAINFKQMDESVSKCISELPERCQEIFYLSRYEHLSNGEIAKKLGLSIQTVKNQISKALKYLHAKLDHVLLVFFIVILA